VSSTTQHDVERKRHQEFTKLLLSFRDYARSFLKIKTKAGQIVPLVFNTVQTQILETVERAMQEGKLLRFLILKARQEGVSTFFEALMYHRANTRFHHKALIVGHEMESSNNLYEMVKRYYDNLEPHVKPELQASNEKKIAWGRLDSEIKVMSAESRENLARSSTFQDLHLTEVAFWPGARASLGALLQTVADLPDSTMIVIESTANGIGNEFYNLWQRSKAGLTDFIPIFIPWFALPEYSLPFASAAARTALESSLLPDELHLRSTYRLTLEQLNWRRWAIENKCQGDLNLFHQEYPSNDAEAFVASGRPVFDVRACELEYQQRRKPIRTGFLDYRQMPDGKIDRDQVVWTDSPAGYLKLWEQLEILPNDEFRFAAGTDVAEGLAQGDFSVIRVMDRKTRRPRIVLTWHGHIDPDALALEQDKINKFLGGDVYFVTERNNHGYTTVIRALELNLLQYYQDDFVRGYAVGTDKLGFLTSKVTKPVAINQLRELIRTGGILDPEWEFWGECMTFVYNDKGQMGAQGKSEDPGVQCFDDRVMAEALALVGHLRLPPYRSSEVEQHWQWQFAHGKRNGNGNGSKKWKPGMG